MSGKRNASVLNEMVLSPNLAQSGNTNRHANPGKRVGREVSAPLPMLPVMPKIHQFLNSEAWEWSLIPPFSSCFNVQSISQFCQFPKVISQIHPHPSRPSSYLYYNIATSLSLFHHSTHLTAVSTLSPALPHVTLHSAGRRNFNVIYPVDVILLSETLPRLSSGFQLCREPCVLWLLPFIINMICSSLLFAHCVQPPWPSFSSSHASSSFPTWGFIVGYLLCLEQPFPPTSLPTEAGIPSSV